MHKWLDKICINFVHTHYGKCAYAHIITGWQALGATATTIHTKLHVSVVCSENFILESHAKVCYMTNVMGRVHNYRISSNTARVLN